MRHLRLHFLTLLSLAIFLPFVGISQGASGGTSGGSSGGSSSGSTGSSSGGTYGGTSGSSGTTSSSSGSGGGGGGSAGAVIGIIVGVIVFIFCIALISKANSQQSNSGNRTRRNYSRPSQPTVRRGVPAKTNKEFIQAPIQIVYNDENTEGQSDKLKNGEIEFFSGQWKCWYMQNYQKVYYNAELVFYDGTVTGKGSDKIGSFDITGCYNTTSKKVALVKKYIRGTGNIIENLGHSVIMQLKYVKSDTQTCFDGNWYINLSHYSDKGLCGIEYNKPQTIQIDENRNETKSETKNENRNENGNDGKVWQCTVCTYHNKDFARKTCEMCNEPRLFDEQIIYNNAPTNDEPDVLAEETEMTFEISKMATISTIKQDDVDELVKIVEEAVTNDTNEVLEN